MQEPSIISQDALPDPGASTLLLAPFSTPTADEVPRIQVRHLIIFRTSKGDHLTNIPPSLTRHKIAQTIVCSLFNLELVVQKMK